MSREMKFRVIDEAGEIYGFERLREGRWERTTADDMPWEAGVFHIIAKREHFTGLKDKNGKDIYAGSCNNEIIGNIHDKE